MSDDANVFSRRQALKGTGVAAAAVAASLGAPRGASAAARRFTFHGERQSGITTPLQGHLVFATFDVTASSRSELEALLRDWSAASQTLIEGRHARSDDPYVPPADTGETLELPAAGLTLTFGFGPSLFDHRFALATRRPAALRELPAFPGDRLDPERSGGDLCVQACADDPIVAFHAIRTLARRGAGVVALRHLQLGAGPTSTPSAGSSTPRNLLGFKDGTSNLVASHTHAMDEHVWVGTSDQAWMSGGTYLVARRIRMHLEEWQSLTLATQQAVIGRFRASGAPLTGHREHDAMNFSAMNHFGELVISTRAHVRVASASHNNGVKILRRGYNFVDGVDSRTGELDAGLMFLCFQKDPHRQFVVLQRHLAAQDALSTYTTHTSSGVYACPPGAPRGGWIGEPLFS